MAIINQCDSLLHELYEFPKESLFLGGKIYDDRLELFERQIGYVLPIDYKYIIGTHNGISVFSTTVDGLDEKYQGSSIDQIYLFEHNANKGLPNYFLPISYDGRGNFYCVNLAIRIDGLSPVLFWQSDYYYDNIESVEVVNDNFMDWFQEVVIEWNR